ncbi:unnamed protein product [Trichobilharzia szidati]|nr:unnamed protein product [Trichobilharzia szidati]
MFRWLIPFRRNSRDALRELDSLQKLRKYPILLGCLSSGILYHNYVSQSRPSSITLIENKHIQKATVHPIFEDLILLFSDDKNYASNKPSNEAKMDRLVKLNQEIEDELPLFFEKGFFDEVPKNLLDPDTVVYYQRKNGSVHQLKGRSWIRTLVVASRAYFSARSYDRRLELTSILSDTEKWEVEVCFRIVLLPAPSKEESSLPPEKLIERLEQRAQWHNFRATFHLSDSGKINAIRLTQILPPFKDSTALYPLNRLAFWKALGPSLPGRRRLPTPTPYVFGEYSWQRIPYTPGDDHRNSILLWTFESIKSCPSEFVLPLDKIAEPFDVRIDVLPSSKDNNSQTAVKAKQSMCGCQSGNHQMVCNQITCSSISPENILCESHSLNSILLELYMKHLPTLEKINHQSSTKSMQSHFLNYSASYISQLRRISYSSDISFKPFCLTSTEQFNLPHCFASFPSTDDISPVFCLPKLYI